MNPSGGFGYHLAAIYSTRGAWRSFRETLARELVDRITRPETATLVLVGPSGGYCLEPSFLERFRRIVAVDIDPWALRILRWRFPKLRMETHRTNFFAGPLDFGAEFENDRKIFLISNLLGQLEFLYPGAARVPIDNFLREFLRRTPEWVSFHDRLTSSDPVFKSPVRQGRLPEFERRPDSVELARVWWGGPRPGDPAAAARRAPEVAEHEIGDWTEFSRGRFVYLPWRLDPARMQLIEICGNTFLA